MQLIVLPYDIDGQLFGTVSEVYGSLQGSWFRHSILGVALIRHSGKVGSLRSDGELRASSDGFKIGI